MKRHRRRRQDGQLYEASGSFYIRYWTAKDNQRVRVSHLLCEKDDVHRNVKSRAVRDLGAAHMQTINTVSGQDTKPVLIADYYTNVYLPFVQRQLKPSTVDGYEEVWRNHLKHHFADRALGEYEPVHGNRLLNEKLVVGDFHVKLQSDTDAQPTGDPGKSLIREVELLRLQVADLCKATRGLVTLISVLDKKVDTALKGRIGADFAVLG